MSRSEANDDNEVMADLDKQNAVVVDAKFLRGYKPFDIRLFLVYN